MIRFQEWADGSLGVNNCLISSRRCGSSKLSTSGCD